MERLKEFNSSVQQLRQKVKLAVPSNDSSLLAVAFQPRPEDVICARGKQAWSHSGNERFREILEMNLEKYGSAITKLEKSIVVSEVIALVYQGDGIFVKRSKCGHWYRVGDLIAREKAGQCLRDMLRRRNERPNQSAKDRKMKSSHDYREKEVAERNTSDELKSMITRNGDKADSFDLVDDCDETFQPLPIDFLACDQTNALEEMIAPLLFIP